MSLSLDNIFFSYPETGPILKGLSVEIPKGDLLLLAGRNGSGKSTLLRLINGLLQPDSGRVLVNGEDTISTSPARLARTLAVTFQNPADQLFASTVSAEVRFGPRNVGRKDPDTDVREALDLLGLGRFAQVHPYDLSPALRKLVTIASAIATGAEFLVFDEPTVNLSQPERVVFRNAIRVLREEGKTFVIVTHDLEFFLPLCRRILVLFNGTAAFLGDPQNFLRRKDELRKTGMRLPYSFRLRSHAGLPVIPK